MSTLVITPCVADANARAVCHPRPLGGPCVGITACAIPLRSSPLGLRPRFVRASEFTRRRMRGPRADSETEERPVRTEGNKRVGGLDELDNQLRSLSSSDNVTPVSRQASKGNVGQRPMEERKKVDWPVFGEGFVLYISVGLVLLTIINNLLFRVFIGPPVPRVPNIPGIYGREGTPSDGAERERFRVRSYKDPKYKYYQPPPVTDEPSS